MSVAQVLEISRQRQEEQAKREQAEKAREEAQRERERQAAQRDAEKAQAAYIALVKELHGGKEIAPEKILERLEKCGETAEQLAADLQALADRESHLKWLQENPPNSGPRDPVHEIADAEKALEDARERLLYLNQNFIGLKKQVSQWQVSRRGKWEDILDVEKKFGIEPSEFREPEWYPL